MTPEQIALVRHTFTPVARQAHCAGAFFYDRLFALEPPLRPLFPGDLQRQGEKFVETLGAMIRALEQEQTTDAASALQQLGQRHEEYGVQPRHYDTLREALLWALAQILGEDFDEDVAVAWCNVYNHTARAMHEARLETASP